MRVIDILIEKTNLASLKKKVKGEIDKSSDEALLNRIYSSLNSGTLTTRLSSELSRLSDPEIQTFIDDIANAIIRAPGSFEEKIAFVDGLAKGYVDVPAMIDGNRHHFSDLLTPTDDVPLKFLFNMFNEMKDLGGRAKKGPGEFALAVMSPKVSVFGEGDLKIGKHIVEVKAEGGTIGATSLFQHQKVPVILQKFLPNIDLTKNIGAKTIANAVKEANLDPDTLAAFAQELTDYIFKGQEKWANTQPLKLALQQVNSPSYASDISKGYLTAAYSAYKGRADKSSKFKGVMLMNFKNQELRYFENPEDMYDDVDTVSFYFTHSNKEWSGKLNAPSVTLKRQAIPNVNFPADSSKLKPAALAGLYGQTAEQLIKMAQQRWPQNLDLRDPGFQDAVTATIKELANSGMNHKKIPAEVRRQYPELSLRELPPVEAPAPKQVRREPTNPPKFTAPTELPAVEPPPPAI